MDLLLARHGRTPWNAAGILQGQTDVPLDDVGRREAQLLAERLSRVNLERIVSSGLARADETAREVARRQRRRVEVQIHEGLRERFFGSWEGLTREQQNARDPRWRAVHRADPRFTPLGPDGETYQHLLDRVSRALHGLLDDAERGPVLVVTHSGVIRALLQAELGMEYPLRFRLDIASGSLTRVGWNQGIEVLYTVNDTSHLEALPLG